MRRPEMRPPRTRVVTGAAVPGWVLRLLVAAVGVLGGLAAGAQEPVQWVVVGAVAVVVAGRPHGMLLALGVAVLAAMYVLGDSPAAWQLPVLLVCTHLVLVLGPLADVASWRARVELAVLRDALPSFVAVQVAAQAAGLLAALLRGSATVPWLVVVALAALGVLTWLVLLPLHRRP